MCRRRKGKAKGERRYRTERMSHITGTSRSRTTSQTNRGDNEEDKRRGEDNEETKEESDKAALVEVVQ